MKALSLTGPGQVRIAEISEPGRQPGDILLKMEMVGLCGTDLNSFRGRNPLVTYPRVLGHEIAATVLEGNAAEDMVAVFGCGGIGLGAIAAAAFLGARTIAIDVDDAKLATAKLAGATDLINSSQTDVRAMLRELTDGDGPDVVIEAIGLTQTFQMAVEEVAFTGRVVYIGYAKEPVVYETKLFVQKELDILGSRNALPEDFLAVMKMLEAGHFPVNEAVTRIVSLDQAPAILAEWSANPAAFTKIMIEIDH